MCRTYGPCETEIITRCISLSIIHTEVNDSINESEIITRCISISIIYTGADDSTNEYEITTSINVSRENRGVEFIDFVNKK